MKANVKSFLGTHSETWAHGIPIGLKRQQNQTKSMLKISSTKKLQNSIRKEDIGKESKQIHQTGGWTPQEAGILALSEKDNKISILIFKVNKGRG